LQELRTEGEVGMKIGRFGFGIRKMQENLSGFTTPCLNQMKSNSLFSLYGLDGISMSV